MSKIKRYLIINEHSEVVQRSSLEPQQLQQSRIGKVIIVDTVIEEYLVFDKWMKIESVEEIDSLD